MKNLTRVLTIAIIANNLAFTTIQKGDPSPVTGIVMDEKEAKSVNEDLIRKDFLEKEVEERKRLEDLYREKVTVVESQNGYYRGVNETLIKQNKYTKYENYLWFAIGVIVTATTVKIGQKFAD